VWVHFYIRNGVKIEPFIHGGGQERGLRSGTENVLLNVGLGKACELIINNLYDDMSRLMELRDSLYNQIRSDIPEVVFKRASRTQASQYLISILSENDWRGDS